MTRKHLILIAIGFTAFLAASFVVARPAASVIQSVGSRKSAGHLVVHEWGTFTSIAGKMASPLSGDRSTRRVTCRPLSMIRMD